MVFHRISTAARPPDYSPPCRWTFSDVGPTWPFFARTVVLAAAPWFFTVSRPPRAHPTIFHRVVRRFPTSARLSRFQPVPSFWLPRHGFFTVSRPPRAHPTIVHRVVRRFPTSFRLSRFQPVPSFWLARHGFSPYLERRAPTRLYSTVSLDVFRRRPDLAVFSRYRRFGCRAMVFHRISSAARPPDYIPPCR